MEKDIAHVILTVYYCCLFKPRNPTVRSLSSETKLGTLWSLQ